ncbi:inner membrane protein [Enterobacterales bacterium]|nr:inner membrane protein [Enterobacterales bacterium]
MAFLDPTLLILLVFAGLGIISNNSAVTIAMFFLLTVRITPLNQFFPWIERYGLTIGIIILTIGVMAPIASGKISAGTLVRSFMHWQSILAIIVGVVVSWLGGRGLTLMGSQPHLVAGLLIGTVLGVALFKGVPVGPLIAAGLLSLMVGKT